MAFRARRSNQLSLTQNVAAFFIPPSYVDASQVEYAPNNLDSDLQVMGLNGTTYIKWGTTAVTTSNYDVIVLSTANTQVIAIPQWANSVSIMNNNASPSVLLHWGRNG